MRERRPRAPVHRRGHIAPPNFALAFYGRRPILWRPGLPDGPPQRLEDDMPAASDRQAVLDAVIMLADQIARTSPECAEQAMQIVNLVHELGSEPDRALVKDTIEVETADTDLSDARVETTADAVMKAVRAEP
jgi:hypothetical protein